jgi:hypothetical protein
VFLAIGQKRSLIIESDKIFTSKSDRMAGEPIKVFFSYSHKDETLRDELATHLKILERQGVISAWHDRQILPGDEWDHEINQNLEDADIILLLISADFIASNYCWDVEIARALERHETGEALVAPIILRPVDWSSAPFGKLQALPKNAQPVVTWNDRDIAFQNVTQGIRKAAQKLREAKKLKQQQAEQTASSTALQDKLQQYRQEAEQLIAEDGGEISAIGRTILDTLQKTLGLATEETAAIEQSILQPYQTQKANQQQYEQVLIAALQQENPLRDSTRNRLKRLQQALNLSQEEVEAIEKKCSRET